MIDKDLLGEAARFNDAQAEELGLPKWAEQHDVDLQGLLYLAEQRGLRGILTLVMGVDPATLNRPLDSPGMPVDLPENMRALLPLIQAAVVDGICIGIKARQLRTTEIAVRRERQFERLLSAAARALERTQVADDRSGAADEATAILEAVVTLAGEYVEAT